MAVDVKGLSLAAAVAGTILVGVSVKETIWV